MTILLLLLLLSPRMDAPTRTIETERIFQFLLTAARDISWPAKKTSEPLVIAVLGHDALEKRLLAARRAGLYTDWLEYRPFREEEAGTYHIVVVGPLTPASDSLLATLAGQHAFVLVGARTLPAAVPGIEVQERNGRLRLTLHDAAMARAGIQTGDILRRLAGPDKKNPLP